jgi:hypothetical protein
MKTDRYDVSAAQDDYPAQAPRSPAQTAQGAIIMGGFLLGMTAIGAGAYAFRDQIFNLPLATTSIADRLAQPTLPADQLHLPGTRSTDRPGAVAPQLAALGTSHTTLDEGLFSPLSRIFFGAPEVKPPYRPERLGGTGAAEAERLASLRPRVRPADLGAEPVRVASASSREVFSESEAVARLSAPENLPQASKPDAIPEVARVPAVPRSAARAGACPNRLARDIPRRRGGASSADAVLASVQGVDGVKRDQVVVREVLRGNMPGFLRDLVPVSISGRTGDGTNASIVICVTPDYLALGDDRDYVRVPLGLNAAARVADDFNMILPTARMVDMIYRAADVRLSPSPMTPGAQMTTTAYFQRHNDTVEAQRRRAGAGNGLLISGHKKDLVLTGRLASNRGRVAIYGWHRSNGNPIQPLSTVHGAGYADYSHGIRLVSRTAFLNGREVDLRSLMADPRYAGLLSKEGPIGQRVLASN